MKDLRIFCRDCFCCLLVVSLSLGVVFFPAQVSAKSKGKFIVGSKEFTEQLILGHMVSAIMADAGYDVDSRVPLGGTNIVRQALLSKQIDGYVEYTGTATMVFFKEKQVMSAERTYEMARERDAKVGLVWLPPIRFNSTYCLMMRREMAKRLGIKSMSDLGAYLDANPGKLKIVVNNEFFARPDGLPTMLKTYGYKLDITTLTQMDSGLIYLALKDGRADVGLGFATDGRIKAYDFVALEDDRRMFPVYNPCLVVRKPFLDKNPSIALYFAKLAKALDNEAIVTLNYRVAEKKEDPKAVATEFLKARRIIK